MGRIDHDVEGGLIHLIGVVMSFWSDSKSHPPLTRLPLLAQKSLVVLKSMTSATPMPVPRGFLSPTSTPGYVLATVPAIVIPDDQISQRRRR
jgi:hypothetical protein